MIRLAWVSIVLFTAGCAVAGKTLTPAELRRSSSLLYEFDVDVPLDLAFRIVAENTIKCFQEHSEESKVIRAIDPAVVSYRVNAPLSADRNTATVELYYRSRWSYGIIQVIDFSISGSGGTSISVFGLDDSKKWQDAAESVEYWFNEPDNCWRQSVAEAPRVFVTNEYFTFGSPDYFSVAVKLADFDSDGDLDALMVNGRHWARQDLVLFNNGDGRFLTTAPLGEQASGYSPAVVDLNHDGKDDIVIARDRIVSQRFMGLGNGKFDTGRPVGRAGPARAVVSADLDNDGEEDLVFSQRGIASYVAFGPDFETIVEFGDSEQYVRLAVADIDRDEDLDIVIANLGAEGSAIYLNDGAGIFDQVIRLNPSFGQAVDIAVGDFDGDGRPDVAVARITENVIFLNDADHTFEKIVVFGFENERSYGIDVGDLDRDGDIDIAIANDGVRNTIYINAGDATFERHILQDDPNARSYGVTIGDLNGDGFADLVYANSGSMSRVYLNATEETAASMLSR